MQKLTATDKCILMAVQAALQEKGWIPLLDEYAGVLRLGDFILYLYQDSSDLEGKTGTKFCYSAGELADSALNTTKKAINYKMHYYLPEYHWWMECCGVLVAMGKFKKTFGAIYHGSATEKVKQQFMEADVSDIQEHLAYQFNIIGDSEGIFYVEVKDGVLSVEPYEYFDRDAILIASADTFMKIAQGKLDPVLAFTLQKLKVEGSIDKALKLKELIASKKKKKK